MRKILTAVLIFGILPCRIFAQQINVENVLKSGQNKPFTFNGGLSAGNVFYSGNGQSGRQPWTYYLNGNLNMNIYGIINVPVSVNLTNLGAGLSYPSLPNRLSLHPNYRWATAHIGDISMTFSPYTLNGHQFTGGGADLTPGKFKIGIMGGRLLRRTEYSAEYPPLMPVYERWGYGAKVQYDAEKFSAGMIYFGAGDRENETIASVSDSLGINPMQNSAFSWNVGLRVVKDLTFAVEYGLSILTRDIRAVRKNDHFTENIFAVRTSTGFYHAVNAMLNYRLMKNVIGIAYERIDPQYQTLGAYYFNNDYENVVLNYSRPFLKQDKANISASFGVQRDNLDDTKEETFNRYVGSVNLNYNPTEDLQTSFNFSTFQSYRNLKSQFDYINEMSPYDNTDTLQFTQLSRNMDASARYTFQKSETSTQLLNLNISFQQAADRQGGIFLPGNVSRFVNAALGYGLTLIPQNISITVSANGTYNYSGMVESFTAGPVAGITGSFFKKTLSCGFSTSYNVNIHDGNVQAKVLNCRINSIYRFLKRHNLNAGVVWQNRNLPARSTNMLTTTVAYAYSF
ncbi:MAG: hypothetical protein LBL04_17290 [Bacteroidales bacterium]|jgi:hypothetical protein|nr:hypothetical protein [Bacteroidales bacterium]